MIPGSTFTVHWLIDDMLDCRDLIEPTERTLLGSRPPVQDRASNGLSQHSHDDLQSGALA
jgi:hypothetical protein